MSVSNGQDANQTTFNNAFVSRTVDTSTVGKVDLANAEAESGPDVENLQREVNSNNAFSGRPAGSDFDATPVWTNTDVGDPADNLHERAEALTERFNDTTGHMHNGDPGEGPPIAAEDLSGFNNFFSEWQVEDFNTAAGTSDDVTASMTGRTAGGDVNIAGVITDPPYNRVEIRNQDTDKPILDGDEKVYGRLTFAAAVWTLSYYTAPGGVETAYDLPLQDIRFYFREVFTAGTRPTIPESIFEWGSGSGSGGSGGINYINSGVAGWIAYADAAGVMPVDGTGGSPTVTITETTSLPLRGASSPLITKDAANRQGEGVSYDYEIDRADRAKVLGVSFDYEIASGTFVSGDSSDLRVWMYDITNAVLIPVTPYTIQGGSGSQHKFQGIFQTASNSVDYRLIIHVATTSASAYTFKFDNVVVGPQANFFGAAIGDPVAYTPVFTGFTSNGSTFFWTRVGKYMRISGRASFSGAATGTIKFDLPVGYSADVDFLNQTTFAQVGFVEARTAGGLTHLGAAAMDGASLTTIAFGGDDGANGWNATTPITWAINDVFFVEAMIPIAGWASTVQMSNDTDTRVVNLAATKAAGNHTSSGSEQDVTSWTTVKDSHGAFNASTGVYTVPVSGVYRVYGKIAFAANATGIRYSVIQKNAVDTFFGEQEAGSGAFATSSIYNDQLTLVAGDTIRLQAFQDSGGNLAYDTGSTSFYIERLSGPASIAATELVAARYTSNAGQSIANGATPIVDFEDKDFDTHGSVTTGASWKFTAPISGTYEIGARIRYDNNTAWAANSFMSNQVFKNGAAYAVFDWLVQTAFTNANVGPSISGTTSVKLLAGEYLDIRTSHNEASPRLLLASGIHVFVDIKRIGNY